MDTTNPNHPDVASVPWRQIATFAVIATVLAYPFRSDLFGFSQQLLFGVPVLQALLEGAGVLIATLLLTRGLRRYWSPATFLGESPVHAILVWLTPVLVLSVVGVENTTGVNAHVFGFVLGTAVSVYCLFEEMGWRGFLQNATVAMATWKRFLLVGVIWYVWHLSFLQGSLDIGAQLQFLLILVAGSFLLGTLVDKTKSVLLAAGFHFMINMLAFNRISGTAQSDNEQLFLIALIVLLWVVVLTHWNIHKKKALLHDG